MSWQLFRWTWRLEGPLFVGTSPAGALNRCRLYVPARAVWGALTAELTRLEATDDQQYRQVGQELREYARFSYLYPAELAARDWLAWLPEYREGDGLVWVREDTCAPLSDRRFRRRLLWTRPATAIDRDNDSALEGSLRETECVQPYWRRDDSLANPVGMVGYVFLRDGEDLRKRLSALSTLFVGGDIRYGLGRLNRVAMVPAKEFFGATVAVDDAEPRVFTKRTLGHALAANGTPMSGQQEAIGGWDMASEQQGELRISGPLWAPGSRAALRNGPPRFQIDERGIWHLDEQSATPAPSNGAPSS